MSQESAPARAGIRLVDTRDSRAAAWSTIVVPLLAMGFSGLVAFGCYYLAQTPGEAGAFEFQFSHLLGLLIIAGFIALGPTCLIYWFQKMQEWRKMVPGELDVSVWPIQAGEIVTFGYSRQFEGGTNLTNFSARIVIGRWVRDGEHMKFKTLKTIPLERQAVRLRDGILAATWEVTVTPPEDPKPRGAEARDGVPDDWKPVVGFIQQYGNRPVLEWRFEVQAAVEGFPADDSIFHLDVVDPETGAAVTGAHDWA